MAYYLVPVVETGGMMTHGPVPVPMRAPLGYQDAPNKFICLGDVALISTTAPLSDPRAIKLADGKAERPALAARVALANHVTDGRRFDRVTDRFNGSILELLKTPPPKGQWRTFPLNQDPGIKRSPGFYVHLDPDDVDGSLPFAFEAGPKLHASKGWMVPMNGGPRQFDHWEQTGIEGSPYEDISPYLVNHKLKITPYGGDPTRIWRANGRLYKSGQKALNVFPFDYSTGLSWTCDSANVEMFAHFLAYSTVGTASDRQSYWKCFTDPALVANVSYAFFLKADAGSSSVGAFVWSDTASALATSYVAGVTMPGEWYAIYTGSAWSIYRNGVLITGPSTDTTVDTTTYRGCWYRWDTGSDQGYCELTKMQFNDVGYTFPDAVPVLYEFPSTAVLDDANRANGGLGANWTTVIGAGGITSNQIKPTPGNDFAAYWNVADFGVDAEVYCDIVTVGDMSLLVNWDAGAGGWNGLGYIHGGKSYFYKTYVGTSEQIVDSLFDLTLAAGDGIGFRKIGQRLEAWVRRGLSGVWRPYKTVTSDGLYPYDAAVGFYLIDGTVIDNFGGGTVVPITELQEAEVVEGGRSIQLHATDNAFLPEKD